jgi:carboxymethylenebutenolidase
LKAAFVCYGGAPAATEMARIQVPVYGFYGGNDARITAAVPAATEQMKAAGKTYDTAIYEGAGHGFMRSGEQPNASAANKKAHDEAWAKIKEVLQKL